MTATQTAPHVPPVTVSALHYEWETPEEAFDRCLNELALDGIEFSVAEGMGRPHLLESEYDVVGELATSWPLEVSAHLWRDLPSLGSGGAVDRLRQWLALAQHMHFRHLVIHGGVHDDQRAGVAMMTEVLASVACEYAAAGVTLCVENHYAWDYRDCHELFGSADELLSLFEAVPSPGIGFCLDYGHSHMTGNTEELLRRVGSRLFYTHLTDNMGEIDEHLPFGRGTVPWRKVLTLTRESGYRGPFTVEFPVRDDDLQPLRDCLALIHDVYAAR